MKIDYVSLFVLIVRPSQILYKEQSSLSFLSKISIISVIDFGFKMYTEQSFVVIRICSSVEDI